VINSFLAAAFGAGAVAMWMKLYLGTLDENVIDEIKHTMDTGFYIACGAAVANLISFVASLCLCRDDHKGYEDFA
jgi:hypothetical protein